VNTGKRTKTQPEKAKSQEAIDGVANAIQEIDPDIIFLQEVEGTDSLGAFAEKELSKNWRPLIIKGNDARGIHIGVLIKNSVPLVFEYQSHRDEPFSNPHHPDLSRVFSRDFPVLIAKSPVDDSVLFLMAGAHGKSKRSENNQDPESREIRTAQAERMVEIIQYYQTQYPKVPFLILGDFNAEVSSEPEYKALRDFNLKDVFELMPNPIPSGDPKRISHTYHPRDGARKASQLDSILVAPPFQNIVREAQVYRYKNSDGSIKPIPDTFEERQTNPSDHFPIWAELDLQKILKKN
jgi:endonuclease/exonuclease/phosphatase family metal-dependent hydrolase